MVEEERKFAVPPDWRLPDLSPTAGDGTVRALPPVTLVATYPGTVDPRLARWANRRRRTRWLA